MNASTLIRGHRRRGMTLVELLIVIAIIGGLFALVWPTMSSELDEWSFRSTTEQIEAQLLLARSEAMRSRSPLEVVYVDDGERREVRVQPFVAGLREIEQTYVSASRGGATESEEDQFVVSDPEDGDVETDLGSWSRIRMADAIRLLDSLPESMGDMREEGESLDLSADELDEFAVDLDLDTGDSFYAEETRIRLAIFLGDGTALASGPLWIIDETGRLAVLRINPWTGAPSIEREAMLEDEKPSDLDEDDSYETDDEFDDASASQPGTGGES